MTVSFSKSYVFFMLPYIMLGPEKLIYFKIKVIDLGVICFHKKEGFFLKKHFKIKFNVPQNLWLGVHLFKSLTCLTQF